jgi:hypothetical protein
MGNERRRHPRVAADLPFRFVNERGEEEPFELLDLSESGARIRCTRGLPLMTRVGVGLVLPGRRLGRKEDVRLETGGVVVWCHPLDEGGRHDTGVFFQDLTPEQRRVLRAFVQGRA